MSPGFELYYKWIVKLKERGEGIFMDLTITLTGRDAHPRVINVKQYSSKADNISFILGDDIPMVQPDTVCTVTGCGCIQELSLDGNTALWCISSLFTQKTGSFGVQLKITTGDTEWYSDVMLLIVSESETGDIAEATTSDTPGHITTLAFGITDNGINGIYKEVE
jgi:hypothetical protein